VHELAEEMEQETSNLISMKEQFVEETKQLSESPIRTSAPKADSESVSTLTGELARLRKAVKAKDGKIDELLARINQLVTFCKDMSEMQKNIWKEQQSLCKRQGEMKQKQEEWWEDERKAMREWKKKKESEEPPSTRPETAETNFLSQSAVISQKQVLESLSCLEKKNWTEKLDDGKQTEAVQMRLPPPLLVTQIDSWTSSSLTKSAQDKLMASIFK